MAIVIIRTLIIYFALLLTMRLLGKRQLGEMELSEFVLAALIADLASHPLQDMGIPMINGLVPILTLFCCEVMIAGLNMKSIRVRNAFFGKPSMLIVHGQIVQKEMLKNRFTLDELMQELRIQGTTDIRAIEYAILETNGKLNILLYPSESAVTPSTLGMSAEPAGYPVILISDGRVLDANLKHLGHDEVWLHEQLLSQGYQNPKQIYLMTATETGRLYLAAKEETP